MTNITEKTVPNVSVGADTLGTAFSKMYCTYYNR